VIENRDRIWTAAAIVHEQGERLVTTTYWRNIMGNVRVTLLPIRQQAADHRRAVRHYMGVPVDGYVRCRAQVMWRNKAVYWNRFSVVCWNTVPATGNLEHCSISRGTGLAALQVFSRV